MKIGTSETQKIKDKIHAEMRRIALKRHPHCVVCGRRDGILQGGHLIPRKRSEAVRFDLMNVFTQCSGCNSYHTRNMHPFIEWFIKEYGDQEYFELLQKSRNIVKRNKTQLKEILEEYKKL